MATINKEDKTITLVCASEDEASAKVDLQELLTENPGYKPVLIIEDAEGNQVSATDVVKRGRGRPRTRTVMVEVEEPIPDDELTDEEVAEDEAVADSTEE